MQKAVTDPRTTQLLIRFGQGDRNAAAELSPLVYHELRELSASVRRSQTVVLAYPVVPVSNGFGGGIVGVDGSQLG